MDTWTQPPNCFVSLFVAYVLVVSRSVCIGFIRTADCRRTNGSYVLFPFFLVASCPLVLHFGHIGEIIRSELGGHDTPNLVSFKRRERLVGEPAVSMVTSTPKSTIGAVHTMAGTSYR